jgi:hypothetical protein
MAADIVVNPATDSAFRVLAEEKAAEGTSTPAELEGRLRSSYPSVRVIEGISSESRSERWYVYRDGRWINPDRNA